MLHIKIICVGKLKEEFWEQAVGEYSKRLAPLCNLDIVEIPESRLSATPSQAEVDAALMREAEGIEFRIPKNCMVIALAIEGRELDSPKLAEFLRLCGEQGKTRLCFIIGGSMGLAESVKKRADLMLSMSRMTFPHHLARVMLLEQIYRAYKINQGSKYHK